MKESCEDVEHLALKDSDHWEMENKLGELYECPSLLPWERFQVVAQGEETQVEMRSWSWESEKTKAARVAGQRIREKKKSGTKKSGDLKKKPLDYSDEY